MTTVTEAAKRVLGGDGEEAILQGDLERILADPAIAQQFARKIADAARDLTGGRSWNIEDLRDVLEAAVRAPRTGDGQVLEGRYLRKRLREQHALATRYGDPYACVVFAFKAERAHGAFTKVLETLLQKLRRTDMVFVYKRRFVLLLPRMRPEFLEPFVVRLRGLVVSGLGAENVEQVHALALPDPTMPDPQSVLDWAEDRIRLDFSVD